MHEDEIIQNTIQEIITEEEDEEFNFEEDSKL